MNVYDSLNKGNIALHIKKQVASMLFHPHAMIKFHVKEVQQHDNSVDCGVFAVAYATSILHGQTILVKLFKNNILLSPHNIRGGEPHPKVRELEYSSICKKC